MAYMSQTLVVEADSREQAENIVFEEELWITGVWEYNGLTYQLPELSYVEEDD